MAGSSGTPEDRGPLDDEGYGRELSAELLPWGSLTVVSGQSSGRMFSLSSSECVIGRSRSAHVRLEDKPISSKHAKIQRVAGGVQLVDLGSSNGTFLNGRRLEPNDPVELSLGDSVQIAETVLTYGTSSASTQEHTQHLSHLAPQFSGSSALALQEAQALAQLLHTSAIPALSGAPPAPTIDDRIDNFLQMWAVVRRNWVPLLAATVVCALCGNLSVFVKPPPSEATVRIRLSAKTQNNPLQRERFEGPEDASFYDGAQQTFVSAPVVAETLKSMREDPNQWRVSAVAAAMKIERVAPNVFQGSFTHRDPDYAVDFLSHLVPTFMDHEIKKKLQVIQAQVDFLDTQVKERDAELRRTEEALRRFKDKHFEGLPELAQGHFTNREELHMKRAELSAQLSKTNLELQEARRRLAAESPMAARRVAGAAPYETSLIDVRRRLGEAKAKGLGAEHPEVVALNNQAAELERLAAQARSSQATELERSADPGLLQLKNRVADLEVASKGTSAELGEMGAELSRLDKLMKDMPEVEAEYAQLTRSYAASKDVHTRLFAQLRSSELDLELQRTSAKAQYEVIGAPTSLGVPIRRTLVLRTAIGATLGLVIGILIAAIREAREFIRGYKRRRVSIVTVGANGR